MVSRGYDSKKLLRLAGILGDMLWVSMVTLVYCGCISVAPECSLVCCYGLDDEEAIAIIHCWVPTAFNDDILVFTYYEFVLVKGNYTFIVT